MNKDNPKAIVEEVHRFNPGVRKEGGPRGGNYDQNAPKREFVMWGYGIEAFSWMTGNVKSRT